MTGSERNTATGEVSNGRREADELAFDTEQEVSGDRKAARGKAACWFNVLKDNYG